MKIKDKAAIFSPNNIVVMLFSLFYLVNMLFGFGMNEWLALNSSDILDKFQLWRLITFPLCSTETESILLFIFMYGIVAVRLNKYFDLINLKLFLPVLFLCEGILFVYAYHNSPETVLTGTDAASFAIMTMLINIYKKRDIVPDLSGLKKLTTFSLLYLALWICIFAYKTEVLAITGITDSVICGLICGIFAAVICIMRINIKIEYGMMLYIKMKNLEAKNKSEQENIKKRYQNAGQPDISLNMQNEEDDKDDLYQKVQYSEDKEDILNRLLDKINAKGKDALTDEERNFLTEYSKYIK